MYSENYIEIVLTGLGWDFYSKLVMLIYTLNLHYIPFIVVMLKNWWETRRSQEAGLASIVEWRRNYTDIYSMMLVVILFWAPSKYMTFSPSDAIQKIQSESVEDGTVYSNVKDSFNSESREVQIPLGWGLLINFSKGTINQLNEWMKFEPKMSNLLQTFSSVRIKDDQLRQEVDTFFTSCYLPVLSRYRNESQTPVPVPSSSDDISYIGNDLFLSTPGYYKSCSQSQKNAGQCYGAAERMPYQTADQLGIFTGYANDTQTTVYPPTCYSWWTGKEYRGGDLEDYGSKGLKERILNYALSADDSPAALSDQQVEMISGWLSDWSDTASDIQLERQTALIKRMLKNKPPSFVYIKEKHYGNESIEQSWMNKGIDYAQQGIGALGAAWQSTWASVLVETIVPALPMIQSMILFIIIIISAIVLPIGLFSAQTAVAFFFVFFTVLSWSFWWHLADIINEGLLNYMYPDGVALAEFSLDSLQQRSIIGMVTAITYLLFPAIWSAALGIIGFSVVDDMGDFKDSMNRSISKVKR